MEFNRIRAARKKANLTQEELAAQIGVKRSIISKYETGSVEPSLSQLKKIATALDVSVVELLSEDYEWKYLEQEQIADDIKQDMMDNATSWEEYEEAKNTKLSDIQIDLVFADIEKSRLDKLKIAFSRLNEKGQSIAVERIEELAKIPDYQKTKGK